MRKTYQIINDIDHSIVAVFDSKETAELELKKVVDLYSEIIEKVLSTVHQTKLKIIQLESKFGNKSFDKDIEYFQKNLTKSEIEIAEYKPSALIQATVTNNLRIVEKITDDGMIKVDFGNFDFSAPEYLKMKKRDMLWISALAEICKTGYYEGPNLTDLDWFELMKLEATTHEIGPEIEIAPEDREGYDRIVKMMDGEIEEKKESRGGRWIKRRKSA